MDFDEATNSAAAKQKFLINRVMKNESDDSKEEESDILVTEN